MVTPLLNPIRTDGGTLYTFSSATRDLARVFANDDYTFTFSHFACLDFPDISKLKISPYVNEKAFPKQPTTTDYNTLLAEHFQNYIMNFETAILNGEGDDDDYDFTVLRTVSERVFFNWMQKIGAISFKQSASSSDIYYELCDGLSFDAQSIERHSEYVSKRVVKYIGNIDVINSVEVNGDAYNEVYLHIPSTVGASYEVRFGSVLDDNYNGGNYSISGNGENIIGRDYSVTPANLSGSAIYDYDSANDDGNSDDYINTYTGDNGYVIDFNDLFYYNTLAGYDGIVSMNEMSPDNFEFNCILIYYDYKNVSTGEYATNLYGVLFLDNVNGDYIQRFAKYKTTNLYEGNSYALKVDLKMDAYPTSNMVALYDNNNQELLEYFQTYTDAMTKLQRTIDIFDKQQTEIYNLKNRVHELETLFVGMDSLSDMYERIRQIETLLTGTGVTDLTEINKLINELNSRLQSVVSGNVPVELQYNTDVLGAGYGINLVSNNGKIVLNSTLTSYAINDMMFAEKDNNVLNPSDEQITESNPLSIHHMDKNTKNLVCTTLMEGTNLAIVYVSGDVCTNDIVVYIDDTEVNWKKGQNMKLKLKNFVDFDVHSLHIWTGVCDGVYRQHIEVPGDEIPYIPTIEIVCIDTVMNKTEGSFIYEVTHTDDTGDSTGKNSSSSSSTSASDTGSEYAISSESIKDMINKFLK